MRTPFIAAHWKMNKNTAETIDFIGRFIQEVKDVSDRNIVIAPPFTALAAASESLKDAPVILAAQNMFYEEKGAYTGEISARMLVDIGCRYVIIGHSERRQYFYETDETVHRKIMAAGKAGLGVIACIGESFSERESNRTFDVLKEQIEQGLGGISSEIVIAYEPVWAIGTGRTATPEQAQEVHAYIRDRVRALYGNMADTLCIIYGGSVTPENIDFLMACHDVDGVLVGGASLRVESFARIVKFRRQE